ncbi:MAG: putative toxin-antitoxin system toxin component, PIN family [Deltaproteobacteria bacterium CG_4_8_14_3_um_filter_45_9]|nr:MAG: putative toxin-antitoxin system toxin component, PIN family [Deltaproteobacteria bacterium CG03_land_8_20_14_0_80_45_14]PIX24651.1 MAG: putative toxin-antitoxin system toxin component, PIN family [Deltaproteobacteria bacterium CG_4_8_14_3_um_filter_45_9]
MKIFLDTNVLVSAAATRGLCADVLREVLSSQQLIISFLMVNELRMVLRQKLKVPGELIDEFIGMIQQDAHFATSGKLPDVRIQDKDDLMILSSALNGNADLFVTGDRELLDLGKVENMEIVSPRMFWEKLKAQASQKR